MYIVHMKPPPVSRHGYDETETENGACTYLLSGFIEFGQALRVR
jgi:hypothetical protein